MGFFDKYTRFTKETGLNHGVDLLNKRYLGMIEPNRDAIQGKRILDIASHDGRWAFAALEAGASHLTCVDPRPEHTKWLKSNMDHYGIAKNSYTVLERDIHEKIVQFEPNQFDTIFCFGFFYHTLEHAFLMRQFERLNPKTIIMDTFISKEDRRIIVVGYDTSGWGLNAYSAENKPKVIIGAPSRSALVFMFEHIGYTKINFFPWEEMEDAPGDYKGEHRWLKITVRAERE